jgi:DNA-binding Lrp family transcriptional regulator
MDLDATDLRLLQVLQENGRLTNVELAERIGLSPSPCWRRLQRLEESGLIKGYRAVLDRRGVGLGIMAFVNVVIESHSEAEAKAFETAIQKLPEVVACHSVSGQADFVLQVVAEDMDSYADFAMNVIRRLPGIKAMHTSFALKEVKASTSLPLRRLRSSGKIARKGRPRS